LSAGGYGIHSGGPAVSFDRTQLWHDSAGGGAGGRGIERVPSGIVAGGAAGVRRAAWAGPVALSSRRQCRIVARPAIGRLGGASRRTTNHRVVLGGGAGG